MSAHRLDHVTVLYRKNDQTGISWYWVGLEDEDIEPRCLTDVIGFQVGGASKIFRETVPIYEGDTLVADLGGYRASVTRVDDSAEWDNGEIWHMWAERWAREMVERTDEEANDAAKAAESTKARHKMFLKIHRQATR